jgi:hypothetical protein
MRPVYALLSLSMLGLGACAPAWTSLDLFPGYEFSYVVGKGEGPDLQSARIEAENDAISSVKFAKAVSLTVTQVDSSRIRESIRENEEISTLVNSLEEARTYMLDSTGADPIVALSNTLTVNTDRVVRTDTVSDITRARSLERIVEAISDSLPLLGWRMYGRKEHTERTRDGFRVSVVYQFQPEEVQPGKWVVNRTRDEFPGMRSPPSRVAFLAKNLLLPGWGQKTMGKPGRGTALQVTYLASLAGWVVFREIRNDDIHTLNQSTNAIEQANLIRQVNRSGNIKNGLIGVAAGTLLVSLMDALTGQPDLFEFSPIGSGSGMSFGLKLR